MPLFNMEFSIHDKGVNWDNIGAKKEQVLMAFIHYFHDGTHVHTDEKS